MYEVEKGIEMPLKRNGYPWASMEVGDSFEYPTEKRNTISSCSNTYAKKHGVKFACRQVGDTSRCWRVE